MKEQVHADFFARFMAWIFDIAILLGIAFVVTVVLGGGSALLASGDSTILGILAGTVGLILFATLFLLQFLYFGFLWSRDGQTIGMKLFGIKVVDRESGALLSFVKAGLRGWVGYWISGLLFNLGYIWAAFDNDKEAWHDKIFATAVVRN